MTEKKTVWILKISPRGLAEYIDVPFDEDPRQEFPATNERYYHGSWRGKPQSVLVNMENTTFVALSEMAVPEDWEKQDD